LDVSLAIACAAAILGLPEPGALRVDLVARAIAQHECASGGRPEGCSGLEYAFEADHGRHMLVVMNPAYTESWPHLVHAGCHAVRYGNGHAWRGPRAERQCEWVQSRAFLCLPGG
jgi:hypothetical protein